MAVESVGPFGSQGLRGEPASGSVDRSGARTWRHPSLFSWIQFFLLHSENKVTNLIFFFPAWLGEIDTSTLPVLNLALFKNLIPKQHSKRKINGTRSVRSDSFPLHYSSLVPLALYSKLHYNFHGP